MKTETKNKTLPTKCCNSCAFLQCNNGKPKPEAFKNDEYEWYDQENIDRLWNETKSRGKFLTCHSTDKFYYAKDDNKLIACVGFTYAVFIHVKVYEFLGCKYPKYKKAVGASAMTLKALAEAALSIAMGSADLFGTLKIVKEIKESRPLRWPSGFENVLKIFKEKTSESL